MKRLTQLLASICFCLLVASCGAGDTSAEVTTTSPQLEESAESVDSADSSEADELLVDAGPSPAEDELEDPSVPDAPVVTSPTSRQDAQTVGGQVPEADSFVGYGGA